MHEPPQPVSAVQRVSGPADRLHPRRSPADGRTKYSSDRPRQNGVFGDTYAPPIMGWRVRHLLVRTASMVTRQSGRRDRGSACSLVVRPGLLVLVLASWSCSGKQRAFEPLSDDATLEGSSSPSGGEASPTPSSLEPAAEMPSGAPPVDDTVEPTEAECGAGPCPPPCQGCTIGGDCTAAGLVNPSNACQICDPDRDAQGWSNNDGVECDDGSFCTQADRCSAGICSGTARQCDDGIACNGVSECDEANDACSPATNQCETGFLCDATSGGCVSTCDGCEIDGVCLPNGAEQAGNPCLHA